ncbi:TonB-dependent receptor plug domain-containing protein [Methylocaldum marinum]|uniref:TonB-dependent receptor plug domain-containing protein n=1 Tax=Methylocaldum marinum TaxID=1432792 RepID=UPI0038CC07F8
MPQQPLTVPNLETARETDWPDSRRRRNHRRGKLSKKVAPPTQEYPRRFSGRAHTNRFGAKESLISIRGSGILRTFHPRGIKLLQDGVPLNFAHRGFDRQAVEPLSAEFVEIYRGATTFCGAI